MSETDPTADDGPQWRPLSKVERRVLGVLIEKAKTTPDAYPLTLNALTTGCNQKSNRDPQMELEPEDVSEAIDSLRSAGAVTEVHGSSRTERYKHYGYDWLGVEAVEIAVMTELLLRGPQTLGELRGRAARMEPIADVAALRPVVDGLISRGLMIALTPPGRGQIVSHNLYPEKELAKVKLDLAAGGVDVDERPPQPTVSAPSADPAPLPGAGADAQEESVAQGDFDELQREVESLRKDLNELREIVRAAGLM